MEKRIKVDKKNYRRVAETFVALACDNTGQPINAKALDRVMKDITGQRKFFTRLCNIRNDAELRLIFDGAHLIDILNVVNTDTQLGALVSLIELDKELTSLKRKIKRLTKKGKKCKGTKNRYEKLYKIYKKTIKRFRSLLGIEKGTKSSKPKKKYSVLVNFNKKYSGNAYETYLSDSYDDYDDDEDEYDEEYGVEEIIDRRKRKSSGKISYHPIEDEDDDEDDEEDDNEDVLNLIEEQNDKMEKILSAIGAMLSMQNNQQGVVPYQQPVVSKMTKDQIDYQNSRFLNNQNTDMRIDRLEKVCVRLSESIENMNTAIENIYTEDDEDDDEDYEASPNEHNEASQALAKMLESETEDDSSEYQEVEYSDTPVRLPVQSADSIPELIKTRNGTS